MIGIIRIVSKKMKYITGIIRGVLKAGSGDDFLCNNAIIIYRVCNCYLYLSINMLHSTSISKPTLTNTNSFRRIPILCERNEYNLLKKVYKPARGTEHEESNYCIHYLCSYWGIGLLLQERKELGKMIFTRGCETESTIYKATSKE